MKFLNNPTFMLTFHKWTTLFWIGMIIPSALFWSNSIPYLVALSVFAIISGEWSAYQATRVERNQESENITDEAAYKQIIEATARIEAQAIKEALTTVITAELLKNVTDKAAEDVKDKLIGRADDLRETVIETATALKDSEKNDK